jgi:hypothetical protein
MLDLPVPEHLPTSYRGKVSDRLCQTVSTHDCQVRSVPRRPHETDKLDNAVGDRR